MNKESDADSRISAGSTLVADNLQAVVTQPGVQSADNAANASLDLTVCHFAIIGHPPHQSVVLECPSTSPGGKQLQMQHGPTGENSTISLIVADANGAFVSQATFYGGLALAFVAGFILSLVAFKIFGSSKKTTP
jgi:hypothetical protein